jgi:hypothetical protein
VGAWLAGAAGRRRRWEVGGFRAGLDARQIAEVVEVRAGTSASPEPVRPTVAAPKGRGRRPRLRDRDEPSSLHQLALQVGQQAAWR